MITSTPIVEKRARVEKEHIEISSVLDLRSVDSSSEVENLTRTVYKRKHALGKDFEIFKPKKEDTLYFQLFQKHVKPKLVARETISKFADKNLEGTILIIQLMVDLAGFQEFIVANFISQEDDMKRNLSFIITQLISGNNNGQGEICIFGRRSKAAKEFINVVFQFLKYLVNLSETCDQLGSVFVNVILFCKLSCKSNRRVLVVTSVVIATKLCTEFILRKKMVDAKLHQFSGSRYLTNEQESSEILKNFVNHLLNLHQKYSCYPDNALTNAKDISTLEIRTWIRINPAEFITSSTFLLLGKLSSDDNCVIRRKALETCLDIIKRKENVKYANAHIHILLKTLKERTCDTDSITKALAVKFFSNCMKRYPNVVPYDDSLQLIFLSNLYCKDYNVAIESANFFVTFFKLNDIDELEGILRIHNCSEKPITSDNIAILVESFIEISKALSDLPRLLSIITGLHIGISDKQVFGEILYHVVHVLLTGTTVSNRQGVNIVVDLEKSYDLVVNSILPNMKELLLVYEKCILGLKWILKTLLLINYAHVPYARFKGDIAKTVEYIINDIIENNEDSIVLSLSLEMLLKLSQNNSSFKVETTSVFNNCINRIISCYKENIKICQVKAVGAENMALITEQIHLISLISENYELQIIDKLKWKEIDFQEMKDVIWTFPQFIAYQITAATWFIIWELRRLLEEESNISEATILSNKLLEFIKSLFWVFKNYNNAVLNIAICESISDLCVHFHQMKSANKMNSIFNIINFKLDEVVEESTKMVEFVAKFCFEDSFGLYAMLIILAQMNVFFFLENNLETKQKLLWKFIYLHFSEHFITDKFFLNIWHILKYCKVFNKKYGKILHVLIKKLKAAGAVPFISILVHTLLEMYRSKEKSKDLKEIIKDFVLIVPNLSHLIVIKMVISIIMNNENHIPFIEYFIPFVHKMSQQHKLSIISYIDSTLPQNIKTQVPVMNFVYNLTHSKRRFSRGSTSTSTTSLE